MSDSDHARQSSASQAWRFPKWWKTLWESVAGDTIEVNPGEPIRITLKPDTIIRISWNNKTQQIVVTEEKRHGD